jgi:putative ABC transport system permease protein
MQNWRASPPADAPNHFVLNVRPDQVDEVRAAMKAAMSPGLSRAALSAMIRGRLVAVNGRGLTPRSTRTPAHAGWPSGSSIFVRLGMAEDQPPRQRQLV